MERNNNDYKSERFDIVNDNLHCDSPIWIFGYGSLCWNPGFEYKDSKIGYIKGFARRFWQGNVTHRGTEEKPGRVATLVEDNEGVTWGRAFLVPANDSTALLYLANRECSLGGYKTCKTSFYPRLRPSSETDTSEMAYIYVALPENHLWQGTAPFNTIAQQILTSRGDSGHNVEYLFRLAEFMRNEIPEALDDHLFSLERLVRFYASEMKICLRAIMGEAEDKSSRESSPKPETNRNGGNNFVSRVPEKKLRCVNI